MDTQQNLHFEKGQAYIGSGTTTPIDLSRPEFSGLKEVVSKQQISDGDYRWDPSSRQLTPVGSSR